MLEGESGESSQASLRPPTADAVSAQEVLTAEVEVETADLDSRAISAAAGRSGAGALRYFSASLFALLIPVVAAVAASWWLVRDLPEEQILDRAGTMLSSSVATRDVAAALAARIDVLRTLATQDSVRADVATNNAQYEGSAEDIAILISGVDEQWRASLVSGVAPPRLVNYTPGAAALRRFQGLFGDYESLVVADRYGAVASSTELPARYDVSNEPWFYSVLAAGTPRLFVSKNFDGLDRLRISVPLNDEVNGTEGVLQAVLPPSDLIAAAVSEFEAEGFRVAVIGARGEQLFPAGTDGVQLDPALTALTSAQEAATAARRVALSDGSEVFAAAGRVPAVTDQVDDRPDWRVVVYRDASALAGLVQEQMQRRLDVLLVVGLVAVVAALLLAAWLSRPFRRMNEVPRIVATEAWQERLGVSGGLPRPFVESINHLLHRTAGAEEQVAVNRALEQDAEELSAQAERFGQGDRLTTFKAKAAQFKPLAQSLQTVRDNLASQLARVEDAVDEVSDLNKQCRQVLDGTEAADALEQVSQLRSDAEQLEHDMAALAEHGRQLLAGLAKDLERSRQQAAELQSAATGDLEELTKMADESVSASAHSQAQLESIGQSVKRLGELSDRTAVLALNGSIQAAMAGDAGSGFSHIAKELEHLSRQAIEVADSASKTVATVCADHQPGHRRSVITGTKVDSARQRVETVVEQGAEQVERLDAVRQQLLEELERVEGSARAAQALAAKLDEHAASMDDRRKNAKSARDDRQRVALALRDLEELVSSMQGRVPSRAPLSLVEPPDDLADRPEQALEEA